MPRCVDVLLINGRRPGPSPHRSMAVVEKLARGLHERGHDVRWLCLLAGEEPAQEAVDGVRQTVCRAPIHPFRSVQGRLFDPVGELALTRELRDEPPDVVHLFSCAGATSPMLAWICGRLGVPLLLDVDFAETVCHRGDLVDWTGAPCAQFDDAARCTKCCRTASAGGPTRGGALLGALFAPLRGLSPFPKAVDFLNRLDVIVYSMMSAELIVVDTEANARSLAAAGVPERLLHAETRGIVDVDHWVEVYSELGGLATESHPA